MSALNGDCLEDSIKIVHPIPLAELSRTQKTWKVVLHLFPLRLLLTLYALVVMASYALALRVGIVSNNSWVEITSGIFKVATPVAVSAMALVVLGWRWSPSVIQNLLFPYLGGRWVGEIEFADKDSQAVIREATLDVEHRPTSIRFALSTIESTSETLVVHARKIAVLSDVVKLVYIYEVERLEGFPGAGERYRGCAFLDVRLGAPKTITGTYMAAPDRTGVIRMKLERANPWWKVWR